jgi:hypothetical protein
MKIALHIERLVLDGLPVTSPEGARVRAAVERELAAMLANGLTPELRHGGALPRLGAPDITLGPRERPDAIGRHIARSLHAGIGSEP